MGSKQRSAQINLITQHLHGMKCKLKCCQDNYKN